MSAINTKVTTLNKEIVKVYDDIQTDIDSVVAESIKEGSTWQATIDKIHRKYEELAALLKDDKPPSASAGSWKPNSDAVWCMHKLNNTIIIIVQAHLAKIYATDKPMISSKADEVMELLEAQYNASSRASGLGQRIAEYMPKKPHSESPADSYELSVDRLYYSAWTIAYQLIIPVQGLSDLRYDQAKKLAHTLSTYSEASEEYFINWINACPRLFRAGLKEYFGPKGVGVSWLQSDDSRTHFARGWHCYVDLDIEFLLSNRVDINDEQRSDQLKAMAQKAINLLAVLKTLSADVQHYYLSAMATKFFKVLKTCRHLTDAQKLAMNGAIANIVHTIPPEPAFWTQDASEREALTEARSVHPRSAMPGKTILDAINSFEAAIQLIAPGAVATAVKAIPPAPKPVASLPSPKPGRRRRSTPRPSSRVATPAASSEKRVPTPLDNLCAAALLLQSREKETSTPGAAASPPTNGASAGTAAIAKTKTKTNSAKKTTTAQKKRRSTATTSGIAAATPSRPPQTVSWGGKCKKKQKSSHKEGATNSSPAEKYTLVPAAPTAPPTPAVTVPAPGIGQPYYSMQAWPVTTGMQAPTSAAPAVHPWQPGTGSQPHAALYPSSIGGMPPMPRVAPAPSAATTTQPPRRQASTAIYAAYARTADAIFPAAQPPVSKP